MSDQPIDFSQFAQTILTDEDLLALDVAKSRYKNDTWVKFRCTNAVAGVTNPKDKHGNPKPDAKGSRWIRSEWTPLRADGSLCIVAPTVEAYITLFSKADPALLKVAGYTEDQIAYATKLNPSTVNYDKMRDFLAAHDPKTFRSAKDEVTGLWNMTQTELRGRILQGQSELFANPKLIVGDEMYWKVFVKVENGYAKTEFGFGVRHKEDPPKNTDGTLAIVLDPDVK